MTQLSIKPGNFFICGPLTGDLLETEKKFASSEEVLNSYGIRTINQFMLYNSKGLTVENIKYTIMHMASCNSIVTLNHWASCEFAKRQVEIARQMGLDVIDYNKLVLHLTEKSQ